MPINVFDGTLQYFESNLYTSSFVREPHLRNNYIKNVFEDHIDMKNQPKNKTLPNPLFPREAVSKSRVDNEFSSPRIFRNIGHVHLNKK